VCWVTQEEAFASTSTFRLALNPIHLLNLLPLANGKADPNPPKASEVDILTGALSYGLAASGGYSAGATAVVDHQRLSGAGYCYSASMPAMLASSGIVSLSLLLHEPSRIASLRANIVAFKQALVSFPFLFFFLFFPFTPFYSFPLPLLVCAPL